MFDTSTAAARPGHEIIEIAARYVIDAGLGDGDSAFTPGRSVWSPESTLALYQAFVEQPITGRGSFLSKLQHQLAGAPPEAIQLAAEMLYLNVLPLNNVHGRTKRERITTVLSWLPEPPRIPWELDAALDHGVLNGGVGFNVQVWAQLAFLIRFARHWFALAPEERTLALRDPWQFRRHLDTVEPTIPSQRGVLLYLAFPTVYEAIAQAQHKKQIRNAFADQLDRPSSDVDRDLAIIRASLQAESATPVHFYFSPWRDRWLPAKAAGQRAWLVRSDTRELVDRWLADGVVELPIGYLDELPAGVTRGDVERGIELAQPHLDYVARRQMAHDAHAMLSMRRHDLVATVTEDGLWLGTLTDEAVRYGGRFGARAVVRTVRWNPASFKAEDLPVGVRAHLATAGDVVDLTADAPLLAALLADAAADDDVPLSAVDLVPGEAAYDEAPTLRFPDEAFEDRLHLPLPALTELTELIEDRRQVILFGPPGTGKTYLARELAAHLVDAADPNTDRVVLVQFHPSMTYEDFFEGYRPVAGETDGTLRFELQPGPLSALVARARRDPGRPYFMVIDEINRANLAKVFGELYYLLEYRDRGVNLMYRPDLPFTLPENVFLIGTMNTVDRSVVDVDAALRRRFAFFELHPDRPPMKGLLEKWLAATNRDPIRAALLDELNARIEEYDLKVGPAYLMKPDADRADGLARVWRYSILPLLAGHHHGRLTPDELETRYGLEAVRGAVEAADTAPS